MMDAIASIASSLSSATVLTKALMGMKVDQEVIAKVSALQSEIMLAQPAALSGLAERAALLQKIDTLERQLKIKDGWDSQAYRYRLETFPTGAQAYSLKESDESDEPAHVICPNCYQNERKSILQVTTRVRGGEIVECPACNLKLELIKSGPRPPINYRNNFA